MELIGIELMLAHRELLGDTNSGSEALMKSPYTHGACVCMSGIGHPSVEAVTCSYHYQLLFCFCLNGSNQRKKLRNDLIDQIVKSGKEGSLVVTVDLKGDPQIT